MTIYAGDESPNGPDVGVGYFEALHRASADPWNVEQAWYERRKRALLAAALPRDRYRRCYEPGCSAGHVTQMLATRCSEVYATDFSPAAVELAQARTVQLTNVRIEVLALPALPHGRFDLVVLSEVLNYLTSDAMTALTRGLPSILAPGADIVLAHHASSRAGQQVTGGDAHAAIRGLAGMDVWTEILDREFAITAYRWRQTDIG